MPANHLLLLPGMMCDERIFAPQLAALDMPATVADMTSADSLPRLAADVLQNAPESFAAVGLSMGGILAMELWRRAPQRISHLALLDTNPYADTPEKREMRAEQIRAVRAGRLRALTVDSLKPAYLAKANRDNRRLLDLILGMAMDLGEEVFERQATALRDRGDSLATLATIDCPTTVICGAEDHVCPVAYHRLMAERIPGARLVVLPDCGHLPSIERPADVTEELVRLLNS